MTRAFEYENGRKENAEGRNRVTKRKQITSRRYLTKWTSQYECIHATQVLVGRKTKTCLHSRGRFDQIEEIELKKHNS